jgi:glycosyltransferase involved in cell wall biosynthesis
MPDLEPRPSIADAPLSLVLVARDNAPALKEILPEWRKVLEKRKQEFEILIALDGTAEQATQLAAELGPETKVVRDESRRGFGAALRTGIAAAPHPLLCYCTADRQYEPADLAKMLEAINSLDLVAGYRLGKLAPRWLRVAGMLTRGVALVALGIPTEKSNCWIGWPGAARRWLVRWTFGVFVSDPDCVFRLCRRELFSHFRIQSDGTFANSEIIAKANFVTAQMAELPVTYRSPAPEKLADAAGLEKPSWREIRRVFSDPAFVRPTPTTPAAEESPREEPKPTA